MRSARGAADTYARAGGFRGRQPRMSLGTLDADRQVELSGLLEHHRQVEALAAHQRLRQPGRYHMQAMELTRFRGHLGRRAKLHFHLMGFVFYSPDETQY